MNKRRLLIIFSAFMIMLMIPIVSCSTTTIFYRNYTYTTSSYSGGVVYNQRIEQEFPVELEDPKYTISQYFIIEMTIYIYTTSGYPELSFSFKDEFGAEYTAQDETISNYTESINEKQCGSFQCWSLPNFTILSIYTYSAYCQSNELNTFEEVNAIIGTSHRIVYYANVTSVLTYDYAFDLMDEIIDASTSVIITCIPFAACLMMIGKLERKSLYILGIMYMIFGLNTYMNYLIGFFVIIYAYMLNKEE